MTESDSTAQAGIPFEEVEPDGPQKAVDAMNQEMGGPLGERIEESQDDADQDDAGQDDAGQDDAGA